MKPGPMPRRFAFGLFTGSDILTSMLVEHGLRPITGDFWGPIEKRSEEKRKARRRWFTPWRTLVQRRRLDPQYDAKADARHSFWVAKVMRLRAAAERALKWREHR